MRRVVSVVATAVLAVQGAVVGLTAANAQTPRIEMEGAWTAVLPRVVKSSELYMVIRNSGPEADRLMSARSSACGSVQVYESVHAGMSGHSGMGMSSGTAKQSGRGGMAMMGMRPVPDPVEVGAGGHIELKPGGLHLMCMERTSAFAAGAAVPVTLTFERAGEINVMVAVRAQGATNR